MTSEPENSNSPSPSETPSSSTSQSPTSEPKTPSEPAAASRASTGARKPGRPKGTTRKKTTARKSTTAKKPKKVGVDQGEPKSKAKPTPPSSEPIKVDPKQVATILERSGDAIHNGACLLFRLDPDEWDDFGRFTKKELDDLSGPLARIAERHAAIAVAATMADELQIGLTMLSYVGRNVATYRAAEVIRDFEEVSAVDVEPETSGVPVVGS